MTSFEELVSRYFDGSLDDEGLAELHDLLESDDEKQAEFLAAAEIHGRLNWELGKSREMLSPPKVTRFDHRGKIALAAAAAVIVSGVALFVWRSGEDSPLSPSEMLAQKSALGRVIQSADGSWGSGIDRKIRLGEWLRASRYQLASGSITIALDIGGQAMFEGPAEFELLAPDRIRLLSGSIQARFEEPGQGFTIETPNGEVVDLGTEFRIKIEDDSSKVEVVEGSVQLNPLHSESIELGARKSSVMESRGVAATKPGDSPPMRERFTYQDSVPAYHWAFEGDSPEEFPGKSSDGSGLDYAFRPGKTGQVPERIDGVFGKALRFSGNGEYIISPYQGVPGNEPRTVAAWVRIPEDATLHNAYGWASWGHESYEGGYFHGRKWQLSWNPQVKLSNWTQPLSENSTVGGIRTEFGPGWVNGTQDLRDGQWHHLVSIFIGGENVDVATHIRHYIDGRLEPASGYQHHRVETLIDHEDTLSLMMGSHMWVPLWRDRFITENPDVTHRPFFTGFRGDVDELYIFEGALTPLQVWRLYQDNVAPNSNEISPSLGAGDS